MKFLAIVGLWLVSSVAAAADDSVNLTGLNDLVKRRLPAHADKIEFELDPLLNPEAFDAYKVETNGSSRILVTGTTKSALAFGLNTYLEDYANASISLAYSSLDKIQELPPLESPIEGQAQVKYRYLFNTVTFAYTTAFYSWEDWEYMLDWAALHGVNLPLAWVGYEALLMETFQKFGLSQDEIMTFYSGTAFQPWNRFGNIKAAWNGTVSDSTLQDALEMQKQLVPRMVELGMTPILPAFTGFVPDALAEHYSDANIVVSKGSWNRFQEEYGYISFLDPLDPLFTKLQKDFIQRQKQYYGDVTTYYTLDQYNENSPLQKDTDYLRNVSRGTISSLKAADKDAIWVAQGWLFYSSMSFWTSDRVAAYLSGPESGDMLVLDLFSESEPQYERTKQYGGQPWIWCELHDYGGNQGLEGNLDVLTKNFTEARKTQDKLSGVGLSPEGFEGNDIVYHLPLKQAWSKEPVNIESYVKAYVSSRYGPGDVPEEMTEYWQRLVNLVYMNDNRNVTAVPKSIFEMPPAIWGLTNRNGHHPTRLFYNASDFQALWREMVDFVLDNEELLEQEHVHYDMVDITRQMFANMFLDQYNDFVKAVNRTHMSESEIVSKGRPMLTTLDILDWVLSTDKNFQLSEWINAARDLAEGNETIADFMEFQARNQITLWGPLGEIDGYGSKQWSQLISGYYRPLWSMFIDFVSKGLYKTEKFESYSWDFKKQWQHEQLSKRPNLFRLNDVLRIIRHNL
ncbi:hypothetical protein TRVA0_001S08614 [Trichomonascus vanleenenianus]|uniref:alpha-N-acetylglucosaminidase n=1 Tax=Trichomonascus vanleenenianus TaxID=2268995 RepID=UPI003ECB4FB7